METPPTLFIDLDGVLTNTLATLKKMVGFKDNYIRNYNFAGDEEENYVLNMFSKMPKTYIQMCVLNKRALAARWLDFYILTARDAQHHELTKKWLERNKIHPKAIFYCKNKIKFFRESPDEFFTEGVLLDDCPRHVGLINSQLDNVKAFLVENNGLCFQREKAIFDIKPDETIENLFDQPYSGLADTIDVNVLNNMYSNMIESHDLIIKN